MKPQLLKGFRDFLPKELVPRQAVIDQIIEGFELYGFEPQDTPALEYAEILTGKYGEDEKLMYRFKDHGDREVALRYDLTVPLARVLAMHRNEIVLPYKRYQISKVWRADKPQQGRFREFVQCDVDVVGTTSRVADAEILGMMCDLMQRLALPAKVRVNDRRILHALCEKAKAGERAPLLLGTLDKFDKLGRVGVEAELEEREFSKTVRSLVKNYLDLVSAQEDWKALATLLSEQPQLTAAIEDLRRMLGYVRSLGWSSKQLTIDFSIVRGLSYYTSTIFETMLTDQPEFGSIMSGGRYDDLIHQLGGPSLPAVGTSVGLDRLFAALIKQGKAATQGTTAVLIANLGDKDQNRYGALAKRLRSMHIACDLYPERERLPKQFQYAEKRFIPWVAIIGEQEISGGVLTVKRMTDRKQFQCTFEEFLSMLSPS